MTPNPIDAEGPVSFSVDGHVATVLLRRPPHNFLDTAMLASLADTLHALDADENCRVVVLGSEGASFCAGADFSGVVAGGQGPDAAALYRQAMRLFRTCKPIVAALQGAAIGAGAGLALAADFRVAAASSRFSVNFNRLGFHPGFGLSFTLPRLVGLQTAARMFYTGERIGGERMLALGLVDDLAPEGGVHERAMALASEIAASAPRAVQSTRETLRLHIASQVEEANARELMIQGPQFSSVDFREGVAAAAARRAPIFVGR